jgi:hypothetical protein
VLTVSENSLFLSVAASPNLWLKLLKYLKLDPNEFIRVFEESVKKTLIEEYKASPVIILYCRFELFEPFS